MRRLKSGSYTLDGQTSMGGPAKLTIGKGEQITEAQFKALPEADQSLFSRVGTPKAKAKGKTAASTADKATQDA
jgi:hypothetical protein